MGRRLAAQCSDQALHAVLRPCDGGQRRHPLLVAERKPFLLRVDPAVLEALQKWAADDLRSLNAQIEFVLRDAVARAGREIKKKRA